MTSWHQARFTQCPIQWWLNRCFCKSNIRGQQQNKTRFLEVSVCRWYWRHYALLTCPLQVPEGHVVMLSFRLFDMEADPTCRYDYLDVYNGHSRLVQKLGRFCGTFRPGALISTSNTMMLEMVSDDSTGGRGFLASFNAGKPHMEGADVKS